MILGWDPWGRMSEMSAPALPSLGLAYVVMAAW
jgi:hypothetical protein